MKGGVFMSEWDIFEALYTITMLPSDRTTLTTGIYNEEREEDTVKK